MAIVPLAHGQNPQIVPCPTPGSQSLITIPEIVRTPDGVLRATIKNVDGLRTVWGAVGIPGQSTTDTRCASQYMRYYIGEDTNHPRPWPTSPEPLPGPTLRARVGDLVEITFQNLVNPQHFANTLDLGEEGEGSIDGCDVVTANGSRPDWTASKAYRSGASIKPLSNNAAGYVYTSTKAGTSGATAPVFPQTPGETVTDGTVVWTNKNAPIYPTGGDYMPDCLHGSSTSNLHFHGTHTTPSTTGDNVLLFVHPALRSGGVIEPSEAEVKSNFAKVFSACEANGSPTKWEQIPLVWRKRQEELLKKYDATAPYKGQPGKLPHMMQLWPPNEAELAQGLWPQFNIGAFPYCFRLPGFNEPPSPGAPPTLMGQAPGTQWYHAHKHGSTALNVANGMTGAFIIEGKYDDELQKFYDSKLQEKVLVLQQLSSTPFPVTDPSHTGGPGAARPPISVNGRRQPIVTMQPGEVQMWRIVNGDFRDAIKFVSFTPEGSTQSCNQTGPQAIVTPCVSWRQIAQDGVQFDFTNYQRVGAPNNSFNLSPANRADLLVKAPTQPGTYVLQALANTGVNLQTCSPSSPAGCQAAPDADYPFPLLTVQVTGNPVTPAMDFIQDRSDFPQMPAFLDDIDETRIYTRRKLVFGAGNTFIDGKRFDPNKVNQAMLLNTEEEWTVMNEANDKAHPFHIHINPFQIVELFEPNSQAATTKGNPCYVDPNDPSTFKPCPSQQPEAPYIWWDTFGIPTGAQFDITSQCTNSKDKATCPKKLQPYTVCNGTCTETIPGWFKMRSRFVDFTGQYVIHCHILIHEDRGMMQLVEVVTDKTLYTHH